MKHIQFFAGAMLAVALSTACATLPPPTEELDAAKVAVQRAESVNAGELAPASYNEARGYLSSAEAALAKGNETDARPLLEKAAAVGDLAAAQAQAAVKVSDAKARQAQVQELRAKIGGTP